MAHIYADAIEIITDDGYGIPLTAVSGGATYGLASDGHFYLITGRHGLSGSKTITGDTTRTVWYERILADDPGAYSISRNVDFVESGAMEEVSGFSPTLMNTAALSAFLKTNGIYLARRRVKYYRVTSTDGLTFNFELRWTGVVDDQPFNELTYSLQCVDVSKDIFKSSPVEAVNDAEFEHAPEDSKEKAIPIAIGRVAYSPLVNVKESGIKENLCYIDFLNYDICAGIAYTAGGYGYALGLFTKGVTFIENDERLVGKYLSVEAGGPAQVLRISRNSETVVVTEGENTVVFFEEPLENPIGTPLASDGSDFPDWGGITDTSQDVWYFQVLDLTPDLIASTKEIAEFNKNANGRELLSTFDSESKKYQDVSELRVSTSTTNINSTGRPGYSVVSKSADSNGSLTGRFNIVPSNIVVSAIHLLWDTYDLPAVGQRALNLFDQDPSTKYTLTRFDPATSEHPNWKFLVYLPNDSALKEYDELLLLLDFTHRFTSGGDRVKIVVRITAKDIYGRPTGNLVDYTLVDHDMDTTLETVNLLPGAYSDVSRSDSTFFTQKTNFDISSFINDTKKSAAYNILELELRFDAVNSVYEFNLFEIGVIGKRSIGVSSETLYGSFKGETFGTTWDGRETATLPVLTLPEAMEHLVRNYDTRAPVWSAGHAYVVGDKIRGTADTGHIFVCTTAGTAHASTEPTWTDTAGATYSDGTAAWKEFQEIPIDTTSFNVLNSQRGDWLVGRTLTEKTPSIDYYKEMCAQGFFLAILDKYGKLKVKAWRDNSTPAITFNSTNILEGSLGDMVLTPMRRMSNDITVRYDWNPGSGKFNKQIAVTQVDQPAFPEALALKTDGTSLGTFYLEYVYPVAGQYQYNFVTTLDHHLHTGDKVALLGNTDGFDFAPTAVSVTGAQQFRFLSTQMPTAVSTTNGALVKATTATLKWKTYVIGIQNYATAQALWEQCRASYIISKTIQKNPDELANCKWFIDHYAKDSGGKFIWSDDGGETCNLDTGDDHAAASLVENEVAWTARQKKQAPFEVEDNATHSAVELGDPAYFNDAKLTGGVDLLGWVHEKTSLPPAGPDQPPRFRFGLTLNPEDLVETLIIDENGADGTLIYDENGATNDIDENGA